MKMNKLSKSKVVAWIGLILCIVLLVTVMVIPGLKNDWWELIDIFFCFMMVFCHLTALYLEKMSSVASRSLDRLSLIFAILAVLSFIVMFFLNY